MEDDLNFAKGILGNWFLACNIVSTQLDEIWKTTYICLKMEDDLNFFLKWKMTSIFLKIKDDFNFLTMEYNLNLLKMEDYLIFGKIEDDLIFWKLKTTSNKS